MDHDADFALSCDDQRSTSGYCVLLYGVAVSWASKKQLTVALSTLEAEYESATFSVAVLAEIPLRSPQTIFIFIIKKIICWVKVSKNKII